MALEYKTIEHLDLYEVGTEIELDAENEAVFDGKLDRIIGIWEVVSVISSLLVAEWIVPSLARNSDWAATVPLALALALILLSHALRGESIRDIGFRFDNFGPALRLLAIPTLIAVAVLLGLGWGRFGLRLTKTQYWSWLIWLPVWAIIQQYVLQGYIGRRLELVFGKGPKTALFVALVFALLHLPNPWLSMATFTGGIVWSLVYQRAPNLFALAISHLCMSLTLATAFPPEILKSLRVGFRYFI
jgi:membrane protease YdiL (CAAX protease family)